MCSFAGWVKFRLRWYFKVGFYLGQVIWLIVEFVASLWWLIVQILLEYFRHKYLISSSIAVKHYDSSISKTYSMPSLSRCYFESHVGWSNVVRSTWIKQLSLFPSCDSTTTCLHTTTIPVDMMTIGLLQKMHVELVLFAQDDKFYMKKN